MAKILYCLTIVILSLFTSCSNSTLQLFGDYSSEFGKYAEQLDTDKQKQALQQLMETDSSKYKSDLTVRAFYDSISTAGMPWLWFTDEGISSDVSDLLEVIKANLEDALLNTESFYIDDIDTDLDVIQGLKFDSVGRDINEVLMHLEYNLSKAYVKYVTGMRYGFVRPDKLLNKLYFREDRGYWAHLFDYEVMPPNYKETADHLSRDDRMEYLLASKPAAPKLYKSLVNGLKSESDTIKRRKILAGMERCRWRLNHPEYEKRKVLINLPAQQLWTIDNGSVDSMRICCGAWSTKTPLLCSQLAYMQINPEWSLPPKIVESDFARHVGDSAWFARHKYFVVNRKTGDTLNIAHIGREGLKNGGLRFVQRGGANNSLGRIVFRFLNNFSIYLHDTNTRGVFQRDRRTVSHGCVRVQKPFELACFLLPDADDWTRDRIRISMDIPPVTERGMKYLQTHTNAPRPLRLIDYHGIKPKVPVFIVYYTAFPNPDTGLLEYWPDFYGYDKPTLNAMTGLLKKI